MNNTEKLLRAFIEAQGYGIKEVVTHNEYTNTLEGGLFCADIEQRCVEEIIDYQVTKKNGKQDMIKQMSECMFDQLNKGGVECHTVTYNGITMKYNSESKSAEVVDNENI
ncbi:MAG: hypothetical protein Unbinned706contig1000_12 [Prokaryotic dsDNA virus sp.]|nr:MAG: hypothetical protein Unbinned706contig1000_12 [Prokaryotic dsDNA virus sp.]|tara:strand:+ start:14862 stop:15191 length:330 start_codon:yes stop_codon:yes gene_type:complete